MGSIGGQPFDGGNVRALGGGDRQLAGQHCQAIDDHRAGAAIAAVATMFGAGQVGGIAKREQQRRIGIEPVADGLAIDGHAGHDATLQAASALAKRSRRLEKPAMASIKTRLGRIGLCDTGGGSRAPIIFLHGVGSDKSVWAPQLAHFGQQRRAVAFDYPGYGESDFAEGATRDDFALSILAAMDALDIEIAHFCGLSLGGVIAIAIHAAAPARCASLVIADSFAVHPDGQGIYDRSVAASHAMSMRDLAEARSGLLLGSAATDELRTEVIETMAAIDPAAYRLGAAAVWLADQRDRAAAIDVPTRIIVGVEDSITPPALSDALGTLIEGSRVEGIDGAGHLSNAEQPIWFNECVDRFLSGIEQRP